MIGKDEDLIFAAFQVVASSLKRFYNSQEFLIMSLEPSLRENHFLREKGY